MRGVAFCCLFSPDTGMHHVREYIHNVTIPTAPHGYLLDDRAVGEFEPWWGQEFSLLHVVQTSSGVHPTSYPLGTGTKTCNNLTELPTGFGHSSTFRKNILATTSGPVSQYNKASEADGK
jgi:hypothetical protein